MISPLGELPLMAFRRHKHTCYATESNKKTYICCFMRATQAINKIYKLIHFFELILADFYKKILGDSDP